MILSIVALAFIPGLTPGVFCYDWIKICNVHRVLQILQKSEKILGSKLIQGVCEKQELSLSEPEYAKAMLMRQYFI